MSSGWLVAQTEVQDAKEDNPKAPGSRTALIRLCTIATTQSDLYDPSKGAQYAHNHVPLFSGVHSVYVSPRARRRSRNPTGPLGNSSSNPHRFRARPGARW